MFSFSFNAKGKRNAQSATVNHTILVVYSFAILFCLAADASSTTKDNSVVSLPQYTAANKERIDFVSRILCNRLEYVHKGKRCSDFCKWMREKGGNATIFSMHGVDVDFEEQLNSKRASEIATSGSNNAKKSDPFSPDRMNLKLPNENEKNYFKGYSHDWDNRPPSFLQLSLRAARLSLHFGPVVSTTWLAVLSKPFREKVWYNWIASCLASSGAAFIKWGQWASTRSDMFSDSLCDALGTLLNGAPAHSWQITQTLVESSLDIPSGSIFEVFEAFDPAPLASGSIAQVHKARLRNGELVAVKVRHPQVEKLIDMDFRLMTLVARMFDLIPALRWLHIRESISQFSHTMAAQAHLDVEAHHLEVLTANFKAWQHVRFPRPFYASASVILETFEPGKIVTDILEMYDAKAASLSDDVEVQGHDLIPVNMAKFLVTSGVSIYLKMLLVDNLMHADLHPGNIMIDVLKKASNKPGNISNDNMATDTQLSLPSVAPKLGITLVDAGMVAQLTDEESSTFIGLLAALGEGDGRAAAQFALRFSIENNMGEKESETFVQEMGALFAEHCRGYGTNVDVGEVLRAVLGLIRIHHVRIDANYATLVVNVLCIESLARRVCPSYNVLDASKPLLQTYRRHFFESDGVTPKRKAHFKQKQYKIEMPVMYLRKKRADDAFFKKIGTQHRNRTLLV